MYHVKDLDNIYPIHFNDHCTACGTSEIGRVIPSTVVLEYRLRSCLLRPPLSNFRFPGRRTWRFRLNCVPRQVSQQPFIQNAAVRDNITFGLPFNADKYEEALRVSSLKKDLRILTAGDRTEIGEKGINLSGGQRMRVAIARTVYQDADIYLLDDILSAVDSHVGADIFNECIKKSLKSKMVVLVTHSLSFVSQWLVAIGTTWPLSSEGNTCSSSSRFYWCLRFTCNSSCSSSTRWPRRVCMRSNSPTSVSSSC
ncbi:hypothetical protein DVH05_005893 [Phytophthora capsici]|nr:hypothetical protein DVH05_005893 [Phytophthora capsici]